jgi:hypothetical protein
MSFRIQAIPSEILTGVRDSGRDVSDHPVTLVTAGGGEPLRCCLRDAVEGEELILFGYEPVLPASPYREIGPVFAHAGACPSDTADGYPADWRGRKQILRAYDKRGWIHPSTRVHDGSAPEAEIAAILADPEVEQIHSRNVAYGCFMFAITRD